MQVHSHGFFYCEYGICPQDYKGWEPYLLPLFLPTCDSHFTGRMPSFNTTTLVSHMLITMATLSDFCVYIYEYYLLDSASLSEYFFFVCALSDGNSLETRAPTFLTPSCALEKNDCATVDTVFYVCQLGQIY